jgi:hypothetical protein
VNVADSGNGADRRVRHLLQIVSGQSASPDDDRAFDDDVQVSQAEMAGRLESLIDQRDEV